MAVDLRRRKPLYLKRLIRRAAARVRRAGQRSLSSPVVRGFPSHFAKRQDLNKKDHPMADRTYRSGRDRFDRERGYGRQAEQFDSDYGWRDSERGHGQMEGWREEDYGQFDTYNRDREAARDWGRDPSYSRRSSSPRRSAESTFERYTSAGAGSQLAANHGEWPETYGGPAPSREFRDYRGTWSGSDTPRGRDRDPNERNIFERAGDTIAHWLGDDADYGRGDRGYRGRGPRNYARSDERIREDACDRLSDDWHVDASNIDVSVNDGEVTLDGTVASREQKRRAEQCVEDLSGIRHVQNNLRVDNERLGFGSQSNPTSSQA
jgi:osmotically-inducible protein OsmY